MSAIDPSNLPVLRRWAADTWQSMSAMTDSETGLPSDSIDAELDPQSRSGYTSPTNIGGYLWSAVVARDLKVLDHPTCVQLLARTLDSLQGMERHATSGMFYNWYSEATAELLTSMPDSGDQIDPFLSSVDNGWLATGLRVVRNAVPELADQADAIAAEMNFAAFYDADALPGVGAGLLRGGFWPNPPRQITVLADYLGADDPVHHTGHHYGQLVSEPRIASYLGIINDQIPPEHYFSMGRASPANETDPSPRVKEFRDEMYLGITVREAGYDFRGVRIVPTWGGSMFEALMPDLFVPEALWGPRSWGINHRLTVRAQREFGLNEAKFGSWGFSPASKPGGGYSEWGVEPLAMSPTGYPSDLERTRYFKDDRRSRTGTPYGDGVVTPHALFLAMEYEPEQAIRALSRLESDYQAYGPGGFYDAVAVKSGLLADRHLALDQSMILAALGNLLCNNNIRRYFSDAAVATKLRPLMNHETFMAGELA